MSLTDVHAGSRWQFEVAGELHCTNFGIICVTSENQRSPWLNFEAGALAKRLNSGHVIPLAIDLEASDVQYPLGQFQGQPLDEEGVMRIVLAINSACERPLDSNVLERSVRLWWPELESDIARAFSAVQVSDGRVRTERDLLEEVLNTVRTIARANWSPRSGQLEKERRVRLVDELHELVDAALVQADTKGMVRIDLEANKVIVEFIDAAPSEELLRCLREIANSSFMSLQMHVMNKNGRSGHPDRGAVRASQE